MEVINMTQGTKVRYINHSLRNIHLFEPKQPTEWKDGITHPALPRSVLLSLAKRQRLSSLP